MESILIILHVFVCVLLVLTILLQPGKTPGMGSAFGGGGGSANFGPKSPVTILSKITVVLAVGFMASSMTLAWMSVSERPIGFDLAEAEDEAHHPTPGLAFPDDVADDGEDLDLGAPPIVIDPEDEADEWPDDEY